MQKPFKAHKLTTLANFAEKEINYKVAAPLRIHIYLLHGGEKNTK